MHTRYRNLHDFGTVHDTGHHWTSPYSHRSGEREGRGWAPPKRLPIHQDLGDLYNRSHSHAAHLQSCGFWDAQRHGSLLTLKFLKTEGLNLFFFFFNTQCFWHQLKKYWRKRNYWMSRKKIIVLTCLCSTVGFWPQDHSRKSYSKRWCASFVVNFDHNNAVMETGNWFYWMRPLILWGNPHFYRALRSPERWRPFPQATQQDRSGQL